MKKKFRKITGIFLALLMVVSIFSSSPTFAQVVSEESDPKASSVSNEKKQVIGYITQWDAWKDAKAGLPAQGALNQLNIDYSKYTILNYSFFGVANDGSLHSGDFRNKNIYQAGSSQQPSPLLYTDIYSSWDLYLLFGEVEYAYYIDANIAARAQAQGFEVKENGSTWSNPSWNMYNQPLPMPIKKEGGAPGLLELGEQNGVKVCASVGGWSMCKHFSEMAASSTKRARFIEDCKRLIDMGFDGIDLDWEYVGPYAGMNFTGTDADYANFITLIKELREAIGPDKLITSCFSASTGKLANFDWAEIDKYLDYYNFMTYDFNGGWSNKAGHNSPLYSYTDAEEPTFSFDYLYQYLATTGINMSKVTFGMAFYGRGVVTDGAAALNAPTVKQQVTIQPDGPISTCADYTNWPMDVYDGTPNYSYIKQKVMAPNSGWTVKWDDEAKVPYAVKDNFFVSYDNEESIGYKAQYIKDHNLAGTIVWNVFGDLEFGGSVTNYGTKLKKWSDVKCPLATKINEVFNNGMESVAAPTFSLASGSYSSAQNVTITCATADATIRYTTDGTEPTANSAVYSGTINVANTMTLKAKAFKSGMYDSATVTATYTIGTAPQETVATPSFSPAGGSYSSAQSVTMSCATAGATIRYTTDGTEPTTNSTVYSSAINVSATTTMKAKAFKTGMNDSATATVTYTIGTTPQETVATPVFSPAGGTYSSAQNVTISCATAGATIRYTTNGTEPTVNSAVYSGAINVSATTTIKAKAFKTGMNDSTTAAATYTIQGTTTVKAWAPYTAYVQGDVVSYNGKNYECRQPHTSLPGWEPTNVPALWKDYAGAIVVDTVATPSVSPAAGNYSSAQNVTISCTTSGATIRYTTDGSEPNTNSAIYSGAINVSKTTTIKAKAFKSGMNDSTTVTATFTITTTPVETVATPTYSVAGGTYSSAQNVTIACATAGATIRYTTDGSEPTAKSSVYSGAINVSTSTTIKAKAFKSGMSDSSTVTASYVIQGGTETVKAWSSYTAYSAGDIVSYSGKNYECRQAHTSLPGWEPAYVAALWSEK